MEADILQVLLVGIGGLVAAVGGVFIGLWQWDSRRSDERAKDREHELKLANLALTKESDERERQARLSIERLQQQVISIQQTVETRLFTALDQQHGTNRDLTSTIQAHIKLVDEASRAQLGAIQALSQDVAGLKGQVDEQYKAIIDQVGGLLNQTSAVQKAVGDLVACVATYHESVSQIMAGNNGAHSSLVTVAPSGA